MCFCRLSRVVCWSLFFFFFCFFLGGGAYVIHSPGMGSCSPFSAGSCSPTLFPKASDGSHPVSLHCFFFSFVGLRGSVSEPSSPATPLGPYNTTPQTSPGASGGNMVRSPGTVHSPAGGYHPAQPHSTHPSEPQGVCNCCAC